MNKQLHILCFFVAFLTLSGCMLHYPRYVKSGFKDDDMTRKEFKQTYRYCDLHKEKMRFVTLPILWGLLRNEKYYTRVENAPYHHKGVVVGGCLKRSFVWYAIDDYCPKCQIEYRKFKRKQRKEETENR